MSTLKLVLESKCPMFFLSSGRSFNKALCQSDGLSVENFPFKQNWIMDYRVDYRVEYRVDYWVDYRVDYRVNYRVDYRVDYRVEYRVDYRVYYRVSIKKRKYKNRLFLDNLTINCRLRSQ